MQRFIKLLRRAVTAAALLLPVGAAADCGAPPQSDAELVASTRGAAAVADAQVRLANSVGRLWKVGTEPPSYLVGTFHIAVGGIDDPGPVLTKLVANAGELFVEIDGAALQATLERWSTDPSRLFRGPGDRLSDDLTQDERAKAEALLTRYGMPFAMADQIRPLFLVGLLSVPPCAVDLAGKPGLDAALEDVARAANVPVSALETVDEQLAALEGEPGSLDATLRMMLTQALSYEEDWFLYLALYRTEHVGAIWSLGLQQMIAEVGPEEAARVSGAFWDRLVRRRNANMVERMLPSLRKGNRVVAVGALHLPGADGIVELLRARGFAVERVDDGIADDAGGQTSASPAAKPTNGAHPPL